MFDSIKEILIATTNPGKVKEIQSCLGSGFKMLSLNDCKVNVEIEENGNTFEENSRIKATGYAKITGHITIADDSGLEIDALNGEPGIHSARFSGPKEKGGERTLIDHRNIAKVLELLKDVPEEKRQARFVCSLCMANPKEIILETKGTLEGIIIEKEIGDNGFGYDPIFYIPDLNKTVAQLSNEQKNQVSHRGKAIKKLKEKLVKINI